MDLAINVIEILRTENFDYYFRVTARSTVTESERYATATAAREALADFLTFR